MRDIGNWISETYEVFMLDLETVVSASLWDWPIYMVLLAIPVAFLVLGAIVAVLSVPIVILANSWEKHFDDEGIPLTCFGRTVEKAWDVIFLVCMFVLIWLVVAFVVALVAFGDQGYKGASNASMWAVWVLPTLLASGVLFFVIRGRVAKTKEVANLGEEKSRG